MSSVLKAEDDSFTLPYDAELECKQHIVVYDGRTEDTKEESKIVQKLNKQSVKYELVIYEMYLWFQTEIIKYIF